MMNIQSSNQNVMTNIQSSNHFVQSSLLLEIEGITPFYEVYKKLSQASQGAFFLVKDGKVESYIRAFKLAEAVVGKANELANAHTIEAEKAATLESEMRRISAMLIELVIGEVSSWKPNVSDDWTPVIPVDQSPIETEANENTLRQQAHRVFEVRGKHGEKLGWYLNHEPLHEAITEKTIYRCTNPDDPHDNTDTDHGTCYQCPYPIGSAIKG